VHYHLISATWYFRTRFFFLFSEKASLLQKIAAWLSFFLKKEKVEERSQSGLHVRLQGAML
jgi:hypothetical protein